MLALVAAVVLAAGPRAHPAAHLSIYVPRLDKTAELTAFMRAAGQRTALLHPDSWRGEFHPLLYLDPTDPAALAAAGIDPTGSATLSYVADARVSCVTLKDVKRFEERVASRLSGAGAPWKSSADGVPLVGAASAGRVLVGYALKGKEACAVQGQGSNVQVLLNDLAKVVSKTSAGPEWKRAAALPGTAFVVSRYGSTGLKGTAQSLTAEGRTAKLPLPALDPAGPSPYALLAPSGLAFVRARVSAEGRGAMGRTLLAQLLDLCQACDPGAMTQVADAIVPRLTGDVLLRVDKAKVGETLRTQASRYFAVRHAWVVEVTESGEVAKGLAKLGEWKMVKKTLDGYAVSTRAGELLVGLVGTHLYVGNDAAAVKAALEGLDGKAGKLAHGAEFFVDPGLVAKGLSQIPLLDVMGSQDLAALFAVGTELGPLLSASERISGWVDPAPEGAHAFQATWVLKPPAPAKVKGAKPDAGAPP
jgi:hypothetical protein